MTPTEALKAIDATELTEDQALQLLHETLTETVLPQLHKLRISLEVIAAQLSYNLEESFPGSSARIVH